jgi:alanine-synthesizing transaminase
MENRYANARRVAEKHPDFVDLIDTNFHRCGFRYPLTEIHATTDRYFDGSDERHYDPDPAGSPVLRAVIASYYRESGSAADPDSVVVTASASESYSHIFAARCRPGDRILLPRPGYPLFEDIAGRNGLAVDFYDQQQSAGWNINPDHLESIIQPRTAAIVLISPNNPTGSVISASTILKIGELCQRRGLFLVVDEVFSEIVFAGDTASLPDQGKPPTQRPDPPGLPRPAALLPDLMTYTINGVSKLFASPDLKASWILVSGPPGSHGQAVEDLLVQNDLFLSASSLSQFVAAEMFASGMEFTRRMTDEIAKRRDIMLDLTSGIDGLSAIPTAGGIHLPVSISARALAAGLDDEDVAVDLLRNYRLATHPGYLYGMDNPVSLVLSYLAPPDRIRDGMARIGAYLSSLNS